MQVYIKIFVSRIYFIVYNKHRIFSRRRLYIFLLCVDQNERKASLPSLPKQIQDDLHKFRKAQSRKMLHDRLHSYINHLHDNSKSPDAMIPSTKDNIDSDVLKTPSRHLTNKHTSQKSNAGFPTSSLTTGYSPQRIAQQTSFSTNASGKSSPIGRQLQQLSISENITTQNNVISDQHNFFNTSSFHEQQLEHELLNAGHNNSILSGPDIFNAITERNSDPIQGNIQDQLTSNINNENSNATGYDLF